MEKKQTYKTNKTIKKLILILIVIAAITEGCKKYSDGPLISFRSVRKRLFGDYTLTKYTVNVLDSLSLYNDSLDVKIHCFSREDDSNIYFNVYGNRKDGSYSDFAMICLLINKNKILKVLDTQGLSIGTGPFGKGKKPEWEILRLTNKELYMKTTYNGKEYYVELKES